MGIGWMFERKGVHNYIDIDKIKNPDKYIPTL